ncbi:MAG: WD40 repeat domain-containing protein [bacterium]|nr:WD40 repeat domain-containing protein [bacterium]
MVWRQPKIGEFATFSPDGSWFAVYAGFRTLAIFRTADGKLLRFLGEEVGISLPAACSPDGKLLATGGTAKRLLLWRVEEGTLAGMVTAPASDLYYLRFSPDGSTVVSCHDWGHLCLWEVQPPRLRWEVDLPLGKQICPAFSSSGDQLIVGGQGGYVLLRVRDGAILKKVDITTTEMKWNREILSSYSKKLLQVETYEAQLESVSSDGRRVAGSIYRLNVVGVWDTRNKRQIVSLPLSPNDPLHLLALSPDGKVLALFSSEVVQLRSVPRGSLRCTIRPSDQRIHSLHFSPDGKVLALSGDDVLSLWRVEDGSKMYSIQGMTETAVALSPNAQIVATGEEGCYISLWKIADGTLLRRWWEGTHHDGMYAPPRIESISFSPDGSRLAVLTSQGQLSLWRVRDARLLRRWKGVEGGFGGSLCFSPDGKYLAAVGGMDDCSVWLWNAWTGDLVKRLSGHEKGRTNWLYAIRFSPDGKILAAVDGETTANLWDVRTGRLLREIRGGHWASTIAFSPDGMLLAVPGRDDIKLWRVRDGQLVRCLQGGRMAEEVQDLTFSPDGAMLAAAHQNAGILVWRVRDGTLLRTLPPTGERVCFLPDSKRLVTGGGVVALWRL